MGSPDLKRIAYEKFNNPQDAENYLARATVVSSVHNLPDVPNAAKIKYGMKGDEMRAVIKQALEDRTQIVEEVQNLKGGNFQAKNAQVKDLCGFSDSWSMSRWLTRRPGRNPERRT